MALDGDATLTFKIHVVEYLSLHVALRYSLGIFKQTVGKSALAMVDVRNNTKVTDILHSVIIILVAKIRTFRQITKFIGDISLQS